MMENIAQYWLNILEAAVYQEKRNNNVMTMCDKNFKDQRACLNHIRTVHTGYPCPTLWQAISKHIF